ncbi:MAG: pyridoxamine 5'-phosphate oxidase [Crocinitomicaceae bacterium]|jgi:pyridoxamine 5'-phosphate oxidase
MKDILDNFRDSHHEFNQNGDGTFGENPLEIFKAWFENAAKGDDHEANAFVLSTSSLENQSSTRIVYLKEIIDDKFVFYTNYSSQKGKEIAENPKVAMLFFWPTRSQQIRIEGTCTKVDEAVSDAYFESRPRGSKIGAWASIQSDLLESREDLEARVDEYEKKFGDTIPRPSHWGGYQIEPVSFEFWLGKKSRLHERLVFRKKNEAWVMSHKNP